MDWPLAAELPILTGEPFLLEMGVSGLPPERLYPLLAPRRHESLLLSGGTHPLSQRSYIGLDPFLVFTSRGRSVALEGPRGTKTREHDGEPFLTLSHLSRLYRKTAGPGFPPFWSGAIGFLGYELGRRLEKLPGSTLDDLGLPDLCLAFYRHLLSYSHRLQTYTLCGCDLLGEGSGPREEVLRRLRRALETGERQGPGSPAFAPSTLPFRLQSNFSRSGYLSAIRRVQEYICEGDIYQANLSQRFQTPFNGDPYGLFLKLFEINPAPFFAYLDCGPFQVISSSPERFLHLRDGLVETRPIKGTLPRGRTPEEDVANRDSLPKSEKNRAELAMITDLLRNDLGRVSEYGSVHVADPVHLETYTNVFHLVSIVRSRLAQGKDAIDLIRATFPGGSVTGCPKIRSMQIIEELEPTVRSVYTGSIGYLGLDGALDLNIAIRSLLLKNEVLSFQVGGGIVYDSDPEAEYEETLHKAASMKAAILATVRPDR